jgi:SpoVK/Ycf46/Vps4 family AAA+-type ATPase
MRSNRFIAVISVPKNITLRDWISAASDLLKEAEQIDGDEWNDRSYKRKVSIDTVLSPAAAKHGIESCTLGNQKTVILVSVDNIEAVLEHPSAAIADAVIRIDQLSPRYIQKAAVEAQGRKITDEEATALVTMKDEMLNLAMRSGRQLKTVLDAVQHAEKRDSSFEIPKRKKVGLHLEDMNGYGEAKDWGLELARDIQDYKDGIIQWSDVDSGLLLSGPPGCGKTTFAAALARTCSVDFVTGSYASWQSHGHQGDMLKAMRAAFKDARKRAPCIFLIDEIDGFIERGKGHGENGDYMRGVVNGLLEELDGSEAREGVVVIGACNDASVIDVALKRPGRLDHHIEIAPLSAEAREAILLHHLEADIDVKSFAGATAGMTGADLQKLARDARRLARRERVSVSAMHVHACIPALKPESDNVVHFKFH